MKGIGLIGRKVGMTRIFDKDGLVIPVTVIDVSGNVVVQKKTEEKDKYTALQVGFGDRLERLTNRPTMGRMKKAGVHPKRHLKEFRVSMEEAEQYEVGKPVPLTLFKSGDMIDVTGQTKGRGFAGVMKRYNFHGADGGHGVHEYFRHGGSIGTNMTPGRTFKGKKMPGHYGDERVTIQSLKVIDVREEEQSILVYGAVPGHVNSIVFIRKAIKAKKTPSN